MSDLKGWDGVTNVWENPWEFKGKFYCASFYFKCYSGEILLTLKGLSLVGNMGVNFGKPASEKTKTDLTYM
jgi:hypothetical protein